VERCQQAGLVWGQVLYFDATHVLADAALDSLVPRFAVEARAAIHAHLEALFSDETNQQEDLQTAQDVAQDREQADAPGPPTPDLPTPLPVVLSDPERDALALANAGRHDWIASRRRGTPSERCMALTRAPPTCWRPLPMASESRSPMSYSPPNPSPGERQQIKPINRRAWPSARRW
jgi:hypothetical protein